MNTAQTQKGEQKPKFVEVIIDGKQYSVEDGYSFEGRAYDDLGHLTYEEGWRFEEWNESEYEHLFKIYHLKDGELRRIGPYTEMHQGDIIQRGWKEVDFMPEVVIKLCFWSICHRFGEGYSPLSPQALQMLHDYGYQVERVGCLSDLDPKDKRLVMATNAWDDDLAKWLYNSAEKGLNVVIAVPLDFELPKLPQSSRIVKMGAVDNEDPLMIEAKQRLVDLGYIKEMPAEEIARRNQRRTFLEEVLKMARS